MAPRNKAHIAMAMASVHELEGRIVEAVVGYETAAFFYPRAAVKNSLRRLRRALGARKRTARFS